MRSVTIFFSIFFFILTNCKNKEVLDTSRIDELIIRTDSLQEILATFYRDRMDALYKITENRALADSLAKKTALSDTLGFYQFLELSINDINETYHLSQREIVFTHDQLLALKYDLIENQISDSLFNISLKIEREMLWFLEERIDTNMHYIQQIYSSFFASKQ